MRVEHTPEPRSYTASDGSLWHINCDCPPIPVRWYDWSATHDDYDGAPDAHDDRSVSGATREDVLRAVEVWVEENGEGGAS